jgi:crotonobetainyl-CoA:carnitine CoA-transferase CaiB-like acyl-CoA transferase
VATIGERNKNRDVSGALVDMCYAMAVNLTMAEATARFEVQRVPFAMILSPDELTRDPHAVAVGLFEERDHHIVGRIRFPRHPAQFHGTPVRATDASPALGEHTDQVLAELGMADRIADLRASGVVA